jgi:hypothetical protein
MSWIIIEIFDEDKRKSRIIQDQHGTVLFNTEEEALAFAQQYDEAYVVQLT